MREATSGTRQAFEASLISTPIAIDKLTVINSSQAIKNFVRENTVSLGCLSESVIADDLKQGKLVKLQLNSLVLKRHFYHVKHKEKIYSDLSNLFMRSLYNAG